MSDFREARARAKRRKSPWNLLLIPAVAVPWIGAWLYTVVVMAHVYRFLHHGSYMSFPFWDLRSVRMLPEGISGIFVAVGPLFAWLPVAMLFGNLLVHAISPARRALDLEARAVSGTDYPSGQRGLLRIAALMFPAGMVVSALGLVL